MITMHEEKLSEIFDEIEPIFHAHHEELALNQDLITLNPDYERYFSAESNGTLVIYTARVDGDIAGYYVGFIVKSIHNMDILACHTDIFYIKNIHRGSGIGMGLFEFCEDNLRKRGVVRWVGVSKNHLDSSNFFKMLGFDQIETVHQKILR